MSTRILLVILALVLVSLLVVWLYHQKQAPPTQPASPPPAPVDMAEGLEGEELLQHIFRQQNKNLEKIQSLRLTYEERQEYFGPFPPGVALTDPIHILECDAIRRGDRGWAQIRSLRLDNLQRVTFDATNHYLCNPDYVARLSDNHQAEIVDYPWAEKSRELAAGCESTCLHRRELEYAIGTGEHPSLAELAVDCASQCRFEVFRERSGEAGPRFRVELFHDRFPKPMFVAWIDPARGYLFTRGIKKNGIDGPPSNEFNVTLREVAPGIWYPVHVVAKSYRNAGSLQSTEECAVKTIEVNREVPDSQFTWSALPFTEETVIRRTSSSGDSVWMKLRGGTLVPASP